MTQYSEFSPEKQMCLTLLAEGRLNKTEIAKASGVSRGSLYNWLDDSLFVAELDRRKQLLINFGDKMITSKLGDAIEEYWNLIQKTDSDKVKQDGLEYFIDRSLGKTSTNVNINTLFQDNQQRKNKDVWESEFANWQPPEDEE